MPSIYQIKPAFQNLLRPTCRGLVRIGLKANHVTVLAMLLSCGLGAAIAYRPDSAVLLLLLPALLFFRMALNAIDGMMAREHDQKSNLGAFLNESGDILSDAFLYLPLALVSGFWPALVAAAVILAVITEVVGVQSQALGGSRRYDGPMGKSDRAFVFGLMALLLGLGVPGGLWQNGVLAVMVLLLLKTIWNRVGRSLGELSE